MATYSIKSFCLVMALTGTALPAHALAGPVAITANAPVEMWDVMAPRADVSLVVSHIDVLPGQGFDAPGTVIPRMIEIPSRADFKGPGHQSEMWDVATENSQPQAAGVSHIDIQPGQSFDAPAFDYPATTAAKPNLIVRSTYTQTVSTPDV